MLLLLSISRKGAKNAKSMTENELSKILVNIFLKVHQALGPGLLESVYEEAICYE